jgi:hypothetical protein
MSQPTTPRLLADDQSSPARQRDGFGPRRLGIMAVATGAILGGSAIAFSAGASSPLTLTLASSSADSPKAAVGSAMMIRLPDQFLLASDATVPGLTTMNGYTLNPSGDAATVSDGLATLFGVTTAPTEASDGSWSASSADGQNFSAWLSSGLYAFNYWKTAPVTPNTDGSGPSPASDGTVSDVAPTPDPTSTTPSDTTPPVPKDTVDAATAMAEKIDPSLTFAPATTDASSGSWTVTLDVTVDGQATDQSLTFTYDASNGDLTGASGLVATLGPATNFTLLSPTVAASNLPTAANPGVTYEGPLRTMAGTSDIAPTTTDSSGTTSPTTDTTPATDTTPTTDPSNGYEPGGIVGSSPGSGPTTTTGATDPSNQPSVLVTLNDATISLTTHMATDGTTWLLPTYAFTSHNSEWQGPWTSLAIAADSVSLSSTVLPMGAR